MDHDFIKPQHAGSPPDSPREDGDAQQHAHSETPRSDWQKHVVRDDKPSEDEQPVRPFGVPVTSAHPDRDETHRNGTTDSATAWHQPSAPRSVPDAPAAPAETYRPQETAGPYAPSQPSFPQQATAPSAEIAPVAVVEVVSTRGVEYAMLTLTLWLGSFSLLGVLLALINGGASFSALSLPVSVLLVCVPVFSFFFLRLKKAELMQPQLRLDPSKRRFTQFTQLIAFATCLFTVIAFVFLIMTKLSGEDATSLTKAALNVLAVLAVAGGILAYYWVDEHKGK